MRFCTWWVWASLLAGTACAANPLPVDDLGGDIPMLVGSWEGEYWSPESGREGTISFTLEQSADTAFGAVMMVPDGSDVPVTFFADPPDLTRPADVTSRQLTIHLVMVDGSTVRGELDPYRDPHCGCQLKTTFDGTLDGDLITGTFESFHQEHEVTQHGEWRVKRTSR